MRHNSRLMAIYLRDEDLEPLVPYADCIELVTVTWHFVPDGPSIEVDDELHAEANSAANTSAAAIVGVSIFAVAATFVVAAILLAILGKSPIRVANAFFVQPLTSVNGLPVYWYVVCAWTARSWLPAMISKSERSRCCPVPCLRAPRKAPIVAVAQTMPA